MNKELVIAVVLNYNQNLYTVKCIESLIASENTNLKILLVDNGSSKESYESLLKELPAHESLVVERLDDNIGYAQGTNYGLDLGLTMNPKYFLILNNDTIIDKYAIQELVETSKKYNDMARVTGKVYHYEDPDLLQFISFKSVCKKKLSFVRVGVDEKDEGQYDHWNELDMIDDILVLQPAALHRKLGGYSRYLWLNGVNIDLSLKAVNNGYKLVFCPKAKIWHKGSVSIGGRDMNPKLAFWNIQSKLTLRYLYLNRIDFIKYYFKIFFNDISRTLIKSVYLKIFKRQDIFKYALAKLKAFTYFNRWMIIKNDNVGYNPF